MRRGITIKELRAVCPWVPETTVRYWVRTGKLVPYKHPSGGRVIPLLIPRAAAMRLAQGILHGGQKKTRGPSSGQLVEVSRVQLVRAIIASSLSQRKIAEALGYASRQSFVNRLTRVKRCGRMYARELSDWASVLSVPERMILSRPTQS